MPTEFYLPTQRTQVSQGDIFSNIPVAKVKFPEAIPVLKEIEGLLLTHDCEFDKPSSLYVMLTEIRPLNELNTTSQGNVKNYKTLNTFYLPPTDTMPESYIDFRRTYQVDKAFLFDRLAKSLRLKSVTDGTRTALQRQIAIFFGHERGRSEKVAVNVVADSANPTDYSKI
jgi:hypothetical protein